MRQKRRWGAPTLAVILCSVVACTTSPKNTASDDDARIVAAPDEAHDADEIVVHVERCGDGLLQGLEECDDGNLDEGDGCSSLCELGAAECVDCEGDRDCEGGHCVELPDGRTCAAECDGSCPIGLQCAWVFAEAGNGYHCIPIRGTCQACFDEDEDGVCWGEDNCPGVFNGQEDSDGDARGDACDPCPLDALDDSDFDGVCDSDDACPGAYDSQDTDNDSIPDACDHCPDDPEPSDRDEDGICDSQDMCEGDNLSADTDSDGVCDDRDACQGFDDAQDRDGDGVPDDCDVEVCDDGIDNDDRGGSDCEDISCWDQCVDCLSLSNVDPQASFANVTDCVGIDTRQQHESLYFGTGQAWGDVNGDGWLDLYVTRNDAENVLYESDGAGTFRVSPLAGLVALRGRVSGGSVFVDYDNDGDKDLYVLNRGANTLFRNEAGAGFTDVTEDAGVGDPGRGQTAAWGDYDGDGFLDLYVVNWGCTGCGAGSVVENAQDRLYHNEGNGNFVEVSSLMPILLRTGLGFSAGFFDYDNDGDADLYVVNDKGNSALLVSGMHTNHNVLWRNDGEGCGGWCFVDVSIPLEADARVDGMGLGIADFDQDGRLDLAFSNIGSAHLLKNTQENFVFQGDALGLTALGGTTWGTVFLDYDNDGDLDLYLPREGPNALWRHDVASGGGAALTDVSAGSGADGPFYGQGVASADYDKDGRVDLIVGNRDGRYRLYRNVNVNGHHWFRARLEGGGPVNRDAVGSRVYLTTDDGVTQMQEVKCGSSLGSGNDLALHFGLGDATLSSVRVVWSDGTEETFSGLSRDQEWQHAYPTP